MTWPSRMYRATDRWIYIRRSDVALGIPLLVTSFSVVSLAIQLAIRCRRRKSVARKTVPPPPFDGAAHEHVADSNSIAEWTCFVSRRRGTTIFALNCSRFLSCLALLGLSLWTAGIYARQPEHDSVQSSLVPWLAFDFVWLAPCLIYVSLLVLVANMCIDECTRRMRQSSPQQPPSLHPRQRSVLRTSTLSLSQLGLCMSTGTSCH